MIKEDRLPQVDKHKVVVLTITYNHSHYIEETLKGFAMQKTDFPFLCCVFDDASTDGEQDVLKKWIDNHCNANEIEVYDHPLTTILKAPDKINTNCIYVIHLQKVNTWGKPEKVELLKFWRNKGEYIAFCEGDDYWIESLKLQRQVNILDTNSNLSSCWTGYISRREGCHDKDMTIYTTDSEMSIFTLEDWKTCWFTKTLTSLIRSDACKEYLIKETYFKHVRDIHQYYYILKWGDAAYIHSPSAIYNIHEGGICSMVSQADNVLHSYNCYKELYLIERDEFLRFCLLSAINGRLKYRKKNQNSIALLKEGMALSKTWFEKLRLISKYCFYML